MATERVVHDPIRRSMDAIQQRLQKDQLRQQQQQKNEKDKKGASKESHQAVSLPTPPKRSTTKDHQDDDFAAYTKLSHPVDENLLATNLKFSSAKKSIADKVLHTLLRSGDSAQKYLQGKHEKKVEENNYILLDNFVHSRSSSASGSKKASQMISKRSKSRMSMKRLKKSGAVNLPQHLQKFDLIKPMHDMWESYMMQLIKVTGKAQLASTLLSADLHGAFMFVAECKIASFTGVQGIMVRETSETFGIITRDDKFQGAGEELAGSIHDGDASFSNADSLLKLVSELKQTAIFSGFVEQRIAEFDQEADKTNRLLARIGDDASASLKELQSHYYSSAQRLALVDI